MTDQMTAFRFAGPVTLIGGAETSAAVLDLAIARAPTLIAADGGANRFAEDPTALTAIIGDLDSLQNVEFWRGALGERLLDLAEQETTDFEKCLYSVDATYYLAVGFLGGRFDHSLAASHVLLKRRWQRVILIAENEILFLIPRRWRIRLPVMSRVSLFPLEAVRAERSAGLRWPLQGLDLEIGGQIGASNESDAESIEVDLEGGGYWSGVIVSLDGVHLGAALASLGLDGAPEGEKL